MAASLCHMHRDLKTVEPILSDHIETSLHITNLSCRNMPIHTNIDQLLDDYYRSARTGECTWTTANNATQLEHGTLMIRNDSYWLYDADGNLLLTESSAATKPQPAPSANLYQPQQTLSKQ